MTKIIDIERSQKNIKKIAALWEEAVRATHHFLSEQDIRTMGPEVEKALAEIEILVGCVDENGRILGFAGVAEDRLEMLFVDSTLFRSGVGRKLMEHCIHTLGIRYVDVNEQNPNAQAFYSRMGFQPESRSETDGQGRPFPIIHMALQVD